MPGALILALALAALAAVFAIQNASVITVSFLGWSWDASLALVLILTLGAGVLIGYLSGLPATLRRRNLIRKQRRRLDQVERALDLEPGDPLEPLGPADADGADRSFDDPPA